MNGIGRGVLAAGIAACGLLGWSASAAGAATTCTWGGTPAAPTGVFTLSPGLTNVPSAGPLKFKATGALAGGGGCSGKLTYTGQFDAGSSCLLASFEGTVKGLPGVTRFWGKGNIPAPSILYDATGDVVGVENPDIATETTIPHFTDCSAPQGFTGGWPDMFSSVVELFR